MNLLKRVFSERRAILIPLTLFLVGNVIYLAAVVWPLQRTVAGAKDAQYKATQSVLAARALETQAKADRAAKDRADVELRKFYTEILPKDDRSAIGVANFTLNKLAEQSRVTFKSGQWDSEEIKDSTLSRLTAKVTLIGDYASVRKFLYELETAEEFVILESVKLSSASTVQNDNLLELGLEVATYFVRDAKTTAVSR
ncbi:MAG TPA: type 4a pilus biogenesis protein PilO [Vicinamibacterales bacterium]|nr:type 4a pilus biogenesis protein PilO [Vicinamibacterales bacterium]